MSFPVSFKRKGHNIVFYVDRKRVITVYYDKWGNNPNYRCTSFTEHRHRNIIRFMIGINPSVSINGTSIQTDDLDIDDKLIQLGCKKI